MWNLFITVFYSGTILQKKKKKVKENAAGKNVFHVHLYKKGGSTSINISNRLFFINLKIVY